MSSGNEAQEKFSKLVNDLISDMRGTFPELDGQLDALYEDGCLKVDTCYTHCKSVFPERFFDILYKRDEMFTDPSCNTTFLPLIDFASIWHLGDVSEQTYDTLWKYLQLILFSLVGDVEDKSCFGDTEHLFSSIESDDFKDKLSETISQLHDMFDVSSNDSSGDDKRDISLGSHIPNPEDLHSHITGLLDGKLGRLANEIANETAGELDLDLSGASSGDDVFNKLFKDPKKLMGIVKSVGSKLDSKIKSGEISESELMTEAKEMMAKMKNMPGMGKMDDILKNLGPMAASMGLGGGKKGARFNTGAFKQHMQHEDRKQQIVEKLKARKQEKERQEKLEAERIQSRIVNQSDIEALMNEDWFNEPVISKTTSNKNKKNKKKKKKN